MTFPPISTIEMTVRRLFFRHQKFIFLILTAVGVHFNPFSRALKHFEDHASLRPRPDILSSNLHEPLYIQLRPTISHLPCNLTLERSGHLSGVLEHIGNCQGFIGSVILMDVEGNRQAAEIVLPNKVTWRAPMEKVDKALLTIYSEVLPHELLREADWVKDDAVLYHPTVTVVNASVIDEAGHQMRVSANANESVLWGKHALQGISREFDLSCYRSAQFRKIWIVGTSESRRLFDHICSAISNTQSVLNKTIMHGQCGNVYFVNTCQWYCGCDFTPFFDSQPDLAGQLISASCGLHPEYLKDSTYWGKTLQGLSNWALHLKTNQTRVQFRVPNAVNPFKTIPEKYVIARNNFKYQMIRDVAVSTFLTSDVHVMDAFRVTEAVFDLSEDHVHFPSWVYSELARIFFRSLCDMEQ